MLEALRHIVAGIEHCVGPGMSSLGILTNHSVDFSIEVIVLSRIGTMIPAFVKEDARDLFLV